MPFLIVKPEQAGRSLEAGDQGPFEFDWWLGDDLVEAHGSLLVTDPLRRSLERHEDFSGFRIEPAQVRESAFFKEKPGRRALASFSRLQVVGRPGVDDMGLGADRRLVVSGRCLAVLLGHALEQAEIAQFRR